MQGNPIDTTALGGAVPHDLSILGLFLQADIIVKVVMLLLLLASFWSWAVIFDKLMRLRRLRPDATALFPTLLGLVAAIPAVIAYNKLSTDFGRYAGRLEAFSSEFSAILSRQLDEKA